MTAKRINELLFILREHQNGKTIQLQQEDGSWRDILIDISTIESYLFNNNYQNTLRVKPEIKYIPFSFEDAE